MFFILTNLFRIILIILVFNFKTTFSQENLTNLCSTTDSLVLKDNFQIETINIKFDNPRKWTKNTLKLIKEFNSNSSKSEHKNWFYFNISEKYKKKFKADLYVQFKDLNLICKFRSEVRVTGDLWWHLDWKDGLAYTSMQISLLEGNINNITKFKLLLPKSREGSNEVFIANLFRELNFLSPRTSLVNVFQNNKVNKYIFQEDLKKEFIENLGYSEGPILEGDERFTIDLNSKKLITEELSMSRLSNSNYAEKNLTNLENSIDAVTALNYEYLKHHQSFIPSNSKFQLIPPDILKLNLIDQNNNFDVVNSNNILSYLALIYAFDADHNLSIDDLRFYYDPLKQIIMPIYYDGKSNILNETQATEKNLLLNSIPLAAKNGAKFAKIKLNDLNKENFLNKLKNNGLNINKKELEIVLARIMDRLTVIQESNAISIFYKKMNKYFSDLKFGNERAQFEKIKLVFVSYKKQILTICDLKMTNCKNLKIRDKDLKFVLSKTISQKFDNYFYDKELTYLFVSSNQDYEVYKKPIKFENKISIENFTIKHNSFIELEILKDKKKIIFRELDSRGRALIEGNLINGWKFYFYGSKKNKVGNEIIPSNYRSITGCLTFLETKFKGIEIYTENSSCEDSVNFIRSNGSIDYIQTKNSKFDSIDMDFSNILINNININNSGNDCLDLSYGNYFIKNLSVNFCGDKGISVGEKSSLFLNEGIIKNSNIGIASKDSSRTEVKRAEINKVKNCLSAYQKKQEFFGGYINVENINCFDYNKLFIFDKMSLIKNSDIDQDFYLSVKNRINF